METAKMKAEQCQVWRQTGGLRRKTVHFWALHDQKCMGANSMKSVGKPPKWTPFRWKGLQKEKLGQDCEKPNAVKEPAKGLWHSWGFATVAMVIAHAPCKAVRQETNARFLVQVSTKSQNERKSKRKLLWAEKSAKWRSRYVFHQMSRQDC